jgi:hypothetical protein
MWQRTTDRTSAFFEGIITGSHVLLLGWSDRCDKYINSPRRGNGRDSAVGVIDRYKLDDFGYKKPVGLPISAPVQRDLFSHPACCRMTTCSCFDVHVTVHR